MEPTESAVIVPIPQAESAVATLRARLDRAAGWGVPAHVTVLYPFLPPEQIDDVVLAKLSAAVRSVPRFDVAFTHVDWFDDRVVWLAPDPDAPFRALTEAVCKEYPQTLPYGGAFPDVVPHLTVGDSDTPEALRRAADVLRDQLPITAAVDAVQVLCGTNEQASWRSIAELVLGPSEQLRR